MTIWPAIGLRLFGFAYFLNKHFPLCFLVPKCSSELISLVHISLFPFCPFVQSFVELFSCKNTKKKESASSAYKLSTFCAYLVSLAKVGFTKKFYLSLFYISVK